MWQDCVIPAKSEYGTACHQRDTALQSATWNPDVQFPVPCSSNHLARLFLSRRSNWDRQYYCQDWLKHHHARHPRTLQNRGHCQRPEVWGSGLIKPFRPEQVERGTQDCRWLPNGRADCHTTTLHSVQRWPPKSWAHRSPHRRLSLAQISSRSLQALARGSLSQSHLRPR